MLHMNIDLGLPLLETMRVPLYYVLSGLFFKEYSSLGNFVLRKTNKIFIPLIFFFLLSYALNRLYRLIDTSVPDMHLYDLFIKNNFFNIALWFLLSLYIMNIIFYFVHHYLKKEWLRAIVILLFAVAGRILYIRSIQLPMFLSPTFTAFPFFYLGYLLKKTPLPYKNKYDKWNIPAALVMVGIAFLLPTVSVEIRTNTIDGNIFLFYAIATLMVTALLLICKTMVRLPILSYLGKYSIILLGSHLLVRDPFFFLYGIVFNLGTFSPLTAWLSFGSVVASMYLIIPFAKKCLPRLTAQKDFIPVQ